MTHQPELLLLDEPTSNLDISHQVKMLNIIKRMNKERITVLSMFHDLNLASEYYDSIILINQGRLINIG